MKILVVEDDSETAQFLVKSLADEGYVVAHSPNGADGLCQASRENFDVLIVDRMLPKLDGLQLVKELRDRGNSVPVLFLTALSGIDDRVIGLNSGGDDYLGKPFAFAELSARVAALGRRNHVSPVGTKLSLFDLEIDLLSRAVRRAGRTIDLQPREFQLLEYLLRNVGKNVTRAMLLENVWGFHFDPHTNVVEAHISRLRSKIDKGFDIELLHTLRGSGYCLRAPS